VKEKYQKDPGNSVRVIVTVQNGTKISTSNLWLSKEMLGDVYREQGIVAFRRKVRESLAEQTSWTTTEIQDSLGYIGGPVGGDKKPWWRIW
jgi:hypothetical protein